MPRQQTDVPAPPGREPLARALASEFASVAIPAGLPPEPELKLMAMILEDAIACYLRYRESSGAAGQREYHAAERWLFSRDPRWIFSFESICNHLGTDPEFVRGQIRARRLNDSPGRRRQRAGRGLADSQPDSAE